MGKRYFSLEEAADCIRKRVRSLPAHSFPLASIRGETLAENVTAIIDQPPFPRSPLDGYAIRGADSQGADTAHPVRLRVIGTVYAGDVYPSAVGEGEAVRIMTGAPIPDGADTVIRQEDTDVGAEVVSLYAAVAPRQNYCRRGEDFRAGTLLLKAGTTLDYAAVAVLSANGIANVLARRKPHIVVISTGDELSKPGEPLAPGKIYDSNAIMICKRLQELGFEASAEQTGDDMNAVADKLVHACQAADMVITTGGVSVGERDVLNAVLHQLGANVVFDGIALKPGSPTKCALLDGKPILALSGNPFAAAAVFELLGRPLLGALMGSAAIECERTYGTLANDFPKVSNQRRFLRGRLAAGRVFLTQENSSGQLLSLVGCNCLADIPAGTPSLSAGETVQVVLL